jgi:acetylornithine deacetylase/succinyl-diaminopimelate desuccinylase-like protein
MDSITAELQHRLDPANISRWAFELVAIPSPTGDSQAAAAYYADRLRELGIEAQLDAEIPGSPSVIAYVNGVHPGPTLELAGHLDVIPVEQAAPRVEDGVLYGRGACDMKGPLAAVLEVVRLLSAVRERMHGRLMVCAYGLHEAPVGRGQSLLRLVERGGVGDAVICVEGPLDTLAITGRGMSTYEIRIEGTEDPCHELRATAETPHPLLIGLDVAAMLRAWNDELQAGPALPYVETESLFIGQFESGDFYNRVPAQCRLVGTRRYAPHRRFAEVQAEFDRRLDPIRRTAAVSIRLNLTKTRDGFRTAEDAPVAQALREAYREVTGEPLPVAAFAAVGDASIFANEGGLPAVYYGCGLERAHATPEYVPLASLALQARVLTGAAARYLGIAQPVVG